MPTASLELRFVFEGALHEGVRAAKVGTGSELIVLLQPGKAVRSSVALCIGVAVCHPALVLSARLVRHDQVYAFCAKLSAQYIRVIILFLGRAGYLLFKSDPRTISNIRLTIKFYVSDYW